MVVCSTTGDGEVPENGVRFIRHMRRLGSDSALSHVRMAALLLGDTNYSSFCGGGLRVLKALRDVGVSEFYPHAMADDGTGLEAVVEAWIAGLWPALDAVRGELRACEAQPAAAQEANGEALALQAAAASAPTTAVLTKLDLLPTPPAEWEPGTLPQLPATGLFVISDAVADEKDEGTTSLERYFFRGGAEKGVFRVPLVHRERLTAQGAVRNTLRVDVQLPAEMQAYLPGDALGVHCGNEPAVVEALLAHLGVRPSSAVELAQGSDAAASTAVHLRLPCTAREALTFGVDLAHFPKKSFFRLLGEAASDASERRALLFLSSAKGASEYNALRARSPSLMDILRSAPSCRPPLAALLQVLLPLAPRYYSFASSPRAHPRDPTLAFNVAEYTDISGEAQRGLCTALLADAPIGTHVPAFMRRHDAFRLPAGVADLDTDEVPVDAPSVDGLPELGEATPLVFLAPGTGVTPFISFLEHIQAAFAQRGLAHSRQIWLFAGCRNPAVDLLFKDKLHGFVRDGTLSRLIVCASREVTDGDSEAPEGVCVRRGRVNAVMSGEEAANLAGLFKQQARLFMCGDALAMVRDIDAAIVKVLVDQGVAGDEAEAKATLLRWSKEKRVLRDVWG